MDRLELELRELLSDDRLHVPVRAGAVQLVKSGVRRRRRNRAIASSAAAGVVVLAIVATSAAAVRAQHDGNAVLPGDHHTPTPSSSPTPSPTSGPHGTAQVAWNPVLYDATKPFPYPGTVADPAMPWCTGRAMSMTVSPFQGATGSAAGALTITNHGATCALQGIPVVQGVDSHGVAIALPAPADGFTVYPWFALPAGHRATAAVQIFGDTAPCDLGPVAQLSVDLGHGGRIVAGGLGSAHGDVRPRCGTVPASQQTDHYTVSASDWARPDHTPSLAVPKVELGISNAPRTAMQGALLTFEVTASAPLPAHPCLPFEEQLVSLDGSQTYTSQAFLLDCHALGRLPRSTAPVMAMQLEMREDVPVGDVRLVWRTPLPGVAVTDGPVIHVTPAPPDCTKQQLTLTAGGELAHDATRRADYFIFTNGSAKVCSLRAYPGIQFIGADGKPMPTPDRRAELTPFWNEPEQVFVLAPHGGAVSFAIAGRSSGAHGEACPTTKGIKFIKPGGVISDQMYVDDAWPYCTGGHVLVSPVVKGTSGPR
jgi:hypothetical protein